MTRNAAFNVVFIGTGTPYGCTTVPDPVAMTGLLRTGQVGARGSAGVYRQGMSVGGVVYDGATGRAKSSAGLNVNAGRGGTLTASTVADKPVCLSIGYAGQEIPIVTRCGTAPGVSTAASPGTNYTITVTLTDGGGSYATVPSPCPPSGVATCSAGTTVNTSYVEARVESISYSLG